MFPTIVQVQHAEHPFTLKQGDCHVTRKVAPGILARTYVSVFFSHDLVTNDIQIGLRGRFRQMSSFVPS